jgi:hypothetical protein
MNRPSHLAKLVELIPESHPAGFERVVIEGLRDLARAVSDQGGTLKDIADRSLETSTRMRDLKDYMRNVESRADHAREIALGAEAKADMAQASIEHMRGRESAFREVEETTGRRFRPMTPAQSFVVPTSTSDPVPKAVKAEMNKITAGVVYKVLWLAAGAIASGVGGAILHALMTHW